MHAHILCHEVHASKDSIAIRIYLNRMFMSVAMTEFAFGQLPKLMFSAILFHEAHADIGSISIRICPRRRFLFVVALES